MWCNLFKISEQLRYKDLISKLKINHHRAEFRLDGHALTILVTHLNDHFKT